MSKTIEQQFAEIVKAAGYTAAFSDNKNIHTAIKEAAERLKELIGEEIDKYYDSYNPSFYERVPANHLKLKLRIKTDSKNETATVYFYPEF